jgi:hypothetical protein
VVAEGEDTLVTGLWKVELVPVEPYGLSKKTSKQNSEGTVRVLLAAYNKM